MGNNSKRLSDHKGLLRTVSPLFSDKTIVGKVMDKLATPKRKARSLPTLAASIPGVKQTDKTAAERYEVQPDYQRFDQKMNMTRQWFWVPEAITHAQNMEENRRKLVRASKPGYTLLDWGLMNASDANQRATNFNINGPNRGPTSWRPWGPPPPEGAAKWEGDPISNARAIKKIGRIYGAGDVGITRLDRRWIYSNWFDEETRQSYPIKFSDEPGYEHITEPTQLEDRTQVIPASMKYVAVFILPMHREGLRTAPTLTHWASTMVTYSAISRLVVSVAEFIRGLGYNAIPSSNCTALNVPLAIDAGMGELGRNAKLIHPAWGPMCRICKVITDLPLEPDVPIATGASKFCDTCGKCADACPSRAIPQGPRSFEPAGGFSAPGVKQWQVNHFKCSEFWSKVGTNCGICLVSCPFSKGKHWSHQLTKAAISNLPEINPLIVSMDNLFGYGDTYVEEFWQEPEPDNYW